MTKAQHDPFTGIHAVIDAPTPGGPTVDGSLHVDADAICPRCLCWIGPHDYVRLTVADLVEHEACPSPRAATRV